MNVFEELVEALDEVMDDCIDMMIDDFAEEMAISFVIAADGDQKALTALYVHACETLKCQIALKLAGHTDEDFH